MRRACAAHRGAVRTALLLASLAAVACGSSPRFNGEVLDPPRMAAEIQGRNWDGNEFRLSDQRGRVVLLSFGYTSCPDVCPATLSRMKQITDRLGERAERLSVVLVSVDPERDTPERLGALVSAFDPRFLGVALEPEVLWGVRRAYHVQVRKRFPEGSSAGSYFLDHSGWLYAIDATGKLRLRFPFDAESTDIQRDVERLLEEADTNDPGMADRGLAGMRVEGAWARPSADRHGSVAYLQVHNRSGRDDRLLSAESPAAHHAMLHESLHESGMIRMAEHRRGIGISEGDTLSLAPGGLHIMLHGLTAPLGVGDAIELVLHFERAGPVRVSVPVRIAGGRGA